MSWLLGDWSKGEDGRQADGWRGDAFGGNFVTEEFRVRHLGLLYSVWKSPALVVRMYDDGHWSLAEKEWRGQ